MTAEEKAQKDFEKKASDVILGLNDKIKFQNQKRILIDTGSKENLIQIARKNKDVYKTYKELLENDYILYFHQKTISKFYKRSSVSELFQRKDLLQHKGVFYTLDKPNGRKLNNKVNKKLIVIFSCMPNKQTYDSSLMPNRMFPKFFEGIERSLVKNVYTMRIMDLNCSHGSHYISTTNYPTFEEEIQESILKVKEELEIDESDIVLYGGSKGATGAVYHGCAMDLKTLAVDPILNIGGELEQNDRRFLKHLRRENLVPDINQYLNQSNEFQKYIICSEQVEMYYKVTSLLERDKIKMLNILDPHIKYHPNISRNTVPEQLTILNKLFNEKML